MEGSKRVLHQRDLRIRRILEALESVVARKSVKVDGIRVSPRGEDAYVPFENGGFWGNEEAWVDFRFTVTVPEDFTDETVLHVRTGREELWEATNPQFVVRVNGRIEQAFDTKHTDLLLQKKARSGERFDIVLNAYSRAPELEQLPPVLEVTLVDRNSELMGLITDIKMPWEAALLVPEGERDREVTLETLCRAIDLLDQRRPNSPEFDRSVAKAREYLRTEYYDKRKALPPEAIASCIGHTHIDVAWLWDLYQTRHKAVRTFATMLKLMEQYPEFRFMSSQAQLYQFVKEDEPELFERIREAVKKGTWEVEGAMWVEADCNLAGGESLVRQVLMGQQFFRREFGVTCRVLWLPDVFGYSAALPQILKKSGVDYFMTTKISWSEFNLTPYDTFMWKGLDGSEVLTHFSPARSYGSEGAKFDLIHYTTYNAMLSPDQIAGGWQRFQQKGLDNQFLVCFGYGDGGGGSTDWMVENARRMTSPLPGTPAVKIQPARKFFEELDERVSGDPDLPKWSGELYLEFHRGTYTSIGKNKRNNRKFELLARDTELWGSQAKALGLSWPQERMDKIWEDALTLQFHDILPGSSIKKVYDDSDEIYARLFEEVRGIKDAAVRKLAARTAGDLAVFNSLAHTRDDVVFFTAPAGVCGLRSASGEVFPVQQLPDGTCAAFVRGMAAMTQTPLWFVRGEKSAEKLDVTCERFDTPFFSGAFDGSMRISHLLDKQSGRVVEKAGQPLNRIVCYENKPYNYDAWDVNIYYNRVSWDIDRVTGAEVVANGPVLAIVRVSYAYMNSTLQQDVIFYHDIPRIDFDTQADWQEKQTLVKAHFPVDVFYNEATYDVQFGNVKRPTHKNTSWDVARFEVCAHKWADVSEDSYGVSLLNDCKYGHSVDENGMSLSLIKCSIYPNPEADQEHHVFRYALMPHAGGWREARVPEMAYRLNVPAEAAAASGSETPVSAVSTDAPNVIVEAVKPAQESDAIVVRAYECYGRRGPVELKLGLPFKKVYACDLLERRQEEADVSDGTLRVEIKPYEILSFLVE